MLPEVMHLKVTSNFVTDAWDRITLAGVMWETHTNGLLVRAGSDAALSCFHLRDLSPCFSPQRFVTPLLGIKAVCCAWCTLTRSREVRIRCCNTGIGASWCRNQLSISHSVTDIASIVISVGIFQWNQISSDLFITETCCQLWTFSLYMLHVYEYIFSAEGFLQKQGFDLAL